MSSDQKKSQEIEQIKLKFKMGSGDVPPTLNDCRVMYQKSRENRDCEVEWAWTVRSIGKTYRLLVIYPFVRDSQWWDYEIRDDPTWWLFDDTAQGNPVLWQYKSGDFQLALEIVQMVGTRESIASIAQEDDQAADAPYEGTQVFPDSLTDLTRSIVPGTQANRLQDISAVLRAYPTSYFNGKVEIRNGTNAGQVYFEHGTATHATVFGTTGEAAVRELVSWQVAQITTSEDERSDVRTINRHIEYPIREGKTLLDNKKYLAKCKLTFEASFIRAPGSEQHFYVLPSDLHRSVLGYFSHRRSLTDCLRDLHLEAGDWVPVFVHLISQRLLLMHAPATRRSTALNFLGDTKRGIEEQIGKMLSPQTGVYKYQSLLLFLQRELRLHTQTGAPFSIIVMEIQMEDTYAPMARWISSQFLRLASQKIEMLKRPTDIFTHFESLDYALLLPNTELAQAEVLARILSQMLTQTPIAAHPDTVTLKVAMGAASLSEHGNNLERVLACAKYAKTQAKQMQLAVAVRSLKATEAAEFEAREQAAKEAKSSRVVRPARTPHGVATREFGANQKDAELTIDLHNLLIRSGVVTPDQIEQARALINVTGSRFEFHRVLAMEGHIQENTVQAAGELLAMIEGKLISIDEAIKALQLVGNHRLELNTALKRLGRAKTEEILNPFAAFLKASGLVKKAHLMQALQESANTELPLGYVLRALGFVSPASMQAALTALSLVKSNALGYEAATKALKETSKNPKSLPQYLRQQGIEVKGNDIVSAEEELLLLGGVLSETEVLTVRELRLRGNQPVEAAVHRLGYASPECLEAASKLVSLVESGQITKAGGALVLKSAKDLKDPADLERLISALPAAEEQTSQGASPTQNFSTEQTRMVVKFCKEQSISYQEGLEHFGWSPIFPDDRR